MTKAGSVDMVEGMQRATSNKRPFLAMASPVVRVLGLFLLTTPLLVSINWVSAVVMLVCTLFLVPLSGLGLRHFLERSLPLLTAVPISDISMAPYGNPEGREYFSFLLTYMADNSIPLATAITLRVLVIGTPVIMLAASIDPTGLGSEPAQIFRLPSRFVLATMASLRLIGLLINGWQALTRARRARDLDDHGATRRTISQVFTLLVSALRRGTKLTTAMEAHGLDAPVKRIWWHISTLAERDYVAMTTCLAIAIAAIDISVRAGELRFLGAA